MHTGSRLIPARETFITRVANSTILKARYFPDWISSNFYTCSMLYFSFVWYAGVLLFPHSSGFYCSRVVLENLEFVWILSREYWCIVLIIWIWILYGALIPITLMAITCIITYPVYILTPVDPLIIILFYLLFVLPFSGLLISLSVPLFFHSTQKYFNLPSPFLRCKCFHFVFSHHHHNNKIIVSTSSVIMFKTCGFL